MTSELPYGRIPSTPEPALKIPPLVPWWSFQGMPSGRLLSYTPATGITKVVASGGAVHECAGWAASVMLNLGRWLVGC